MLSVSKRGADGLKAIATLASERNKEERGRNELNENSELGTPAMASDQNARDLSHALYQFTLTGKLDAGVSKDDLENWVKKQSKQSKAIDRQLQQDQGKYKSEIVILLLGTFIIFL